MSYYKGNHEECPYCGLTYGKMTTGLSYRDIYEMMKDNNPDPNDWTYKRRNTVLGKWHEIKKQMWDYHINEGGCPNDPRNVACESAVVVDELDEVPF